MTCSLYRRDTIHLVLNYKALYINISVVKADTEYWLSLTQANFALFEHFQCNMREHSKIVYQILKIYTSTACALAHYSMSGWKRCHPFFNWEGGYQAKPITSIETNKQHSLMIWQNISFWHSSQLCDKYSHPQELRFSGQKIVQNFLPVYCVF